MMAQTGAARFLVDQDPARARDALLVVEDAGRQALTEMRHMLEVLRDDGDTDALGPQPGLRARAARCSGRASGSTSTSRSKGRRPRCLWASSSPGTESSKRRYERPQARRDGAGVVVVRHSPGVLDLSIENDGPP